MSHPFTPEYMQEGETSSKPINRDITKQKTNQTGSVTHKSQIRSSTKIYENKSVTEADADGGPRDSFEEIKEEINVTIPDNEKTNFFRIAEIAMRRRIEMFAQEVSIVGLSYLVKPSSNKVGSIIRKIMWTLLLMFGAGFMVFQIYDRTSYYMSYPAVVNYRVAYNRSLRFPTVTICSECFASKGRLISLFPENRESADVRYPPFWDLEFGDSFKALNFSNLDFDWELFGNYVGIKMEDMMLECSFGDLPCNPSDAIKKVTADQGFCLSFNPVSVTTNYVTTQPGANNGLRLVLWVNHSECGLVWTPAVRFRLSMLSSPYGDCRPNENYTYMRCYTQCATDFMVSVCKCRPIQFDDSSCRKL